MLIFVLFLALAVYCFTLEIVETMERRRSARERERERMAELQEEFVGAASRGGADAAAAAGGGCEYCRNSRVSRNRILQQQSQVAAGAGGGLRWIS